MTISTNKPLTQEWVKSINEGKAVVYVWGVVTYTDVMGESLRSEYCAYYRPNTGLSLWACPVGLQIVENPEKSGKAPESRQKIRVLRIETGGEKQYAMRF